MAPLASFKDLCIDVVDLVPEGEFWARTLGLDVFRYDDGDIRLDGPTPQHTVWPCVVPEAHEVKNRVHLDVWAPSLHEFEPLRRLSEPGQFPWTVFADPEGNEFCVFTRDDTSGYRLKDVVVDAVHPESIARWWHGVLGGELGSQPEHDWWWVDGAAGVPFESFDFVPVPEPKTVKNRVHWDITLSPGVGVTELVERGATVLREPDDDISWTVMADPEGNEFCAFDPK